MSGNTKTLRFFLTAAGALLCSSAIAQAGSAVALSEGQLDHITAGSAIVASTADAQATGLKTYATTLSSSILGTNQSVENGFGSEGGNTSGVAVAWGLNPFGNKGGNGLTVTGDPAPAPSSSTNVTTGGAAQGNYTQTISGGTTNTALGQTIQIGFTSVYGVFVPGW
ncbi:MAG: hypothetical protein WA633_14565 [Stellaceae bacterium]